MEAPAADGVVHQSKCKACGWVGAEHEGPRGKMAAAADYIAHFGAQHPKSPYMLENRVMRRKVAKKEKTGEPTTGEPGAGF